MPTQWTDHPATSSTRIRAVHVNELRDVVDCHRSAYGAGSYPWTDTPASASTPIRAVHLTEIRTAVQDLWTRKGMGGVPNWSVGSAPSSTRPISARDINDLRGWLNQYETTGGLRGAKRGIHLRNAGDLRDSDLKALNAFEPGMVVVLSTDAKRSAMLNYLKSIQSSAEIFIRHWPTYAPVYNAYSLYDPGYRYTINYNKATQKSPTDVANEIIADANWLKGQGLTSFRWSTGNEPELEWHTDIGISWGPQFWQDVQHYYHDIYDELVRLGRPCEVYPPSFAQFASLAVEQYNMNGSVTRKSVAHATYTGIDEDFGVHYCRDMIDHHRNGTGAGRFLQHNYFWPGYQAEHAVYPYWPGFLKQMRTNGMPVRITEFGWMPDAVATGQCPSSYCCPANLDTTTTSCDGARTGISAAANYNDYVRVSGQLDGYAVWLVSDASNTFPYSSGVTEAGVLRTWLRRFICYLDV